MMGGLEKTFILIGVHDKPLMVLTRAATLLTVRSDDVAE